MAEEEERIKNNDNYVPILRSVVWLAAEHPLVFPLLIRFMFGILPAGRRSHNGFPRAIATITILFLLDVFYGHPVVFPLIFRKSFPVGRTSDTPVTRYCSVVETGCVRRDVVRHKVSDVVPLVINDAECS